VPRIGRRRPILGTERPAGRRRLAVDLDRTDEDETPHPCGCGLARQVEGALDVDRAELGQGIARGFAHDMHPGRGMDHDVHASQCRSPVLGCVQAIDGMDLHTGKFARQTGTHRHRQAQSRYRGKGFENAPPDKTGGTGQKYFQHHS